jgi:N-acetylmuramoyl-L-alanine amidase
MKLCLDPGHGGHDGGAIGPTGLLESQAALEIAKYVRRGFLDCGWDVFCTRSDDRYVSLQGRCDIANNNLADLMLSIHCNAFSNPAAHGYEVWTSVGQTAADPIAERIFEAIGAAFPNLAPRFDKTDGDSDKEKGFAVLVGTNMAAVLVEYAFISNPIEEGWLRDVGWKMRAAGATVSGVNRRP